MNGMGQPLGYALGLVLGGIFTDTIGWRWAHYMMAIIDFCLLTASIWSLPSVKQQSKKKWTRRLAEDIDWLGALIMSVALGLLLYVLATINYDILPENWHRSDHCFAGHIACSLSRFSDLDELPDQK
ncbi:hypothetical protein TOPH_07116 [Tolypocladium ophioglossoides CBS 100239]|uniref:Major facilitator superfamily (MFS) profile domain-containing protein n=1 Tax=Tolypocladium ophioglossoides (strain CBS 100239) TaxID=1163406 RepID=A0A0L0N2L1_TOLOC|nr:hypothetical protein TOPH_07116 [Tolypocladium ophioglossoides CBS 100239]